MHRSNLCGLWMVGKHELDRKSLQCCDGDFELESQQEMACDVFKADVVCHPT